jgi:hypothetical protein
MEKTKKKNKTRNEKYLVCYDLPKNAACTQDIYHVIKNQKPRAKKSTRSVLIFSDPKKAKEIHKKAKKCGQSSLFKVKNPK